MTAPGGELVIVGCGIQLGRHLSTRIASEIETADRVFVMADPFAREWVRSLRPDAICLARHYRSGRDRRATYRAMEDELVDAVRAGHRVCAVFYGHPGVFADVPHRAIETVRALDRPARMEPGISADACLYADLGLDPGRDGVQAWEATQFLVQRRCPDPSALLILWQVALVGDLALTRFEADPEALGVLVDKLSGWYPLASEVVLYEAAQLPVQRFRADRMPLSALPDATYREYTTLVIPPIRAAEADPAWLSRLGASPDALES